MPHPDSGLSDDDFWTDPLAPSEKLEDRLVDAGGDAWLVDAPDVVHLDLRESLPLLLQRAGPSPLVDARPMSLFTVLAAMDVTRNQGSAAAAFPRPGRTLEPLPSRPPDPAVERFSAEANVVDVRQRLELPWIPGHVELFVIVGERIVGRRSVRFELSPARHDPAVERFHEAARQVTKLRPLHPPPSAAWPLDQRDDETPFPPAEVGIVLAAPRVKAIDDGKATKLRGAFRLPLQPRHRVVPGPDATVLRQQLGPSRPLPTGLVPLMLVATGSISPTPFVWQLVLPTFDAIDPDAKDPEVTGTFAVSLDALGNVKGVEQTLFLYAFSGPAMAGPLPISFTRSEPLR